MKILRSWLEDHITIKDNNDTLDDKLTFSGTLVDSLEEQLDKNIIVAKILEINSHPNADRLHLVKVDTGNGTIEIVCGAPNIQVEMKVPLAQIGAKLPEFEIKEAVIRGIKSEGMLCSEYELGLGENHEGIMVLPKDYEIGKPLCHYINNDAIFDLEITPNRGDCLSHLGVARELSAVLKTPLKDQKITNNKLNSKELRVEIENPENCFRYYATKIKNIKIEPSPLWLQKRLSLLGAKPINNVVDITNYVMLDLGQPLHAYDAKKIGNKIIIRNAKANEKIETLDQETRFLSQDMLLIANEKEPIALAGVMGGANSEIDNNTNEIILESAEFERKNIRKTSKDLRLSTEASYRFERGIDPEIVEVAIDKAAQMICEIAGGKIVEKASLIKNNYENEWVNIEYDKINDLIGLKLQNKEIDDILVSLGFSLEGNKTKAPSWRHDVHIWEDLAEEISRIYEFTNIPIVPVPKTKEPHKSSYYYKEHLKDLMVDFGFSEAYNYSFLSEADVKSLNINSEDLLEVANPIQIENKYLRKSLKPGLLRVVAKNPTFDPEMVFEIGHVFTKSTETTHFSFVVSGKNAKKIIENTTSDITKDLGLNENIFKIEELSRDDLIRFKIKKPITYIVEVNLDKVLKEAKMDEKDVSLKLSDKEAHYRPISKYPSITRDLAFLVEKEVSSTKIIDLIYQQSPLINRVELFDEFASDKLGLNKKNVAFHLDLQDQNKTLTDQEAETVVKKIISVIEKEFSAKLRNY